ncbi:MAG TPA: hypothetical protein VM661_10635 [Candidatus Sulfotelmatobacter sp.]|jgi:hypothetical protein|nr:hypothetical protein [Candidatus Sulfotelmatobacter sp.]
MRWLCILSVLALSGCVSWRDVPDDLRFVALHDDIAPYPYKERGEYVDVEVETNFNYMDYVGSRGAYISFFFCGHQDKNVYGLSNESLYKYMSKWVIAGEDVHDNSSPPYRYHAIFFVASHGEKADTTSKYLIMNYDLRDSPRDLCFYLDVGPYYHEKSNIVRIPKEELVKFFDEHPRPKTGTAQ